MSVQGITTIDFGAAPGDTTATKVITGQTGIDAGALVDAWLTPTDTADHSADEHVIDGPEIFAGSVVAGTGFTIFAKAVNGPAYGEWTVSWVWNN